LLENLRLKLEDQFGISSSFTFTRTVLSYCQDPNLEPEISALNGIH